MHSLKRLVFIVVLSFSSTSFAHDREECLDYFNPVQAYKVDADFQRYKTNLPYEVSSNVDANHSEFYVESFGKGKVHNDGVSAAWIEAGVKVSLATYKDLLNVGMYVKWADPNNPQESHDGLILSLAQNKEVKTPHRKIVFKVRSIPFVKESNHFIEEIAFFVDVRQGDEVVRLWYNNGPVNFTLHSIFDGHRTSLKKSGNTSVEFVYGTSPIFNQKRASYF